MVALIGEEMEKVREEMRNVASSSKAGQNGARQQGGEDVRGWLFKCEQFFNVDGVAEDRKLEAEKARRCGQEFNWKTNTYGKVRYFKDIDYFKDFETDFPAIVYKDALTSEL
nr:hypothetical protein [Tanacetum cinerariifolium]